MPKLKTHFDQVPLELVKKLIEIARLRAIEEDQAIAKKQNRLQVSMPFEGVRPCR